MVVEFERLAQHRPVEPALDGGQRQRPDGAHGAAFGGRGQADEDSAEHQEDEHYRRDQGDDDTDGELEPGIGAEFLGQRRRRIGEDHRHADDIGEIEAGEDEPRNHRAGIHVADRAAELVGHDDEHEAWRDDLCQRSGSRDDAGGQTPVVAVAQHDGQRDEPHGDDRGGDDAGGGGKQGADDHHGKRQAAAHRPEKLADGVEQLFRHARSLQHQAHEGEERHGKQRVVAHHGEEAVGQRLEEGRREEAELDADQAPGEAVEGKREGDRIAEQEHDHQRGEHQRGHIGGDEGDHGGYSTGTVGSDASYGSAMRPCITATRLMISDTAWMASRKKPASSSALAGHRVRPP